MNRTLLAIILGVCLLSQVTLAAPTNHSDITGELPLTPREAFHVTVLQQFKDFYKFLFERTLSLLRAAIDELNKEQDKSEELRMHITDIQRMVKQFENINLRVISNFDKGIYSEDVYDELLAYEKIMDSPLKQHWTDALAKADYEKYKKDFATNLDKFVELFTEDLEKYVKTLTPEDKENPHMYFLLTLKSTSDNMMKIPIIVGIIFGKDTTETKSDNVENE